MQAIECFDFHCHTQASDGQLTPAELVSRAQQQGVTELAITDHDTIAGYQAVVEFAAASEANFRLRTGVELSCQWQQFEIHLLGLNFDPNHAGLQQLLQQQQRSRRERIAAITAKLEGAGYAVTPYLTEQQLPTRWHLANALRELGVIGDIQTAFKRFIGTGQFAYVKPQWVELAQAVETIRAAGGVAVLAHPHAYQLSNKWLRRLIQAGQEAGMQAIEVAIGQQSPGQREALAEFAQQYQLCASVGSDFHYPGGWRELGKNLCLPESCVPVWTLWQD